MEGPQAVDLSFLNTLLRAERVQAISGFAKESPAHGLAGALEQVVFLRADARDLHFAFAFESRGRERGVKQHVREQVQAGREIRAEHFEVHAKAVVPAVTV